MINITPTQLRKAADILEKIQSLQKALGQLLGGSGPAPVQPPAPDARKKRQVSAAAKAKMRAAQKARWAKIKGAALSSKPAPAPKKKMSAQGLANIRAGVAKRMAAMKGAKPAVKPEQKHHISAAAKVRLSALAKARWAKVKKAGKSRL